MTTCTCRDEASACGVCLAVGSPGDQPLHIHCDEHISRLEAENERLRAAAACADLLVRIVRPMYSGPSGDQGLNDPLYGECLRAIERYKATRPQ